MRVQIKEPAHQIFVILKLNVLRRNVNQNVKTFPGYCVSEQHNFFQTCVAAVVGRWQHFMFEMTGSRFEPKTFLPEASLWYRSIKTSSYCSLLEPEPHENQLKNLQRNIFKRIDQFQVSKTVYSYKWGTWNLYSVWAILSRTETESGEKKRESMYLKGSKMFIKASAWRYEMDMWVNGGADILFPYYKLQLGLNVKTWKTKK